MQEIMNESPDDAALNAASIRLRLELAYAAFERGDLLEAGTRYMTLAREAPETGDAWLGLSCVLLEMGEFDRAAALVDNTITPAHRADACFLLSRLLVKKGDFDRAAQLIDRAIALQPNDPRLWEALVTVLERASGPEAVIDYLERHRDEVPKTLPIDLRRVHLCLAARQMRKAERRLRRILEANPDDTGARIALAKFLGETGEEQRGIELLRALTKRPETTAKAFSALADMLRGENTTVPEAITNLRHAISIQPENTNLLRSLSECHARLGRYDEAADLLTTALERSASVSAEDYFRLGMAFQHSDQASRGEAYLHKARAQVTNEIERAAGDPKRKARRSAVLTRILVALGRREEALAHYKSMIQECTGGAVLYDPRLYLPNTPSRLGRLRQIIKGRDTMVLCHGPSISALADWQDRIGPLDVCISALNRFRVFETGFLSHSGRTVDVLLETHYKGVRQLVDQIWEFLERDADNLLITTRWALDRLGGSCPQRREFQERFDEKLLYFGGAGGIQPGTPYDPLRYVYGNSLSTLIVLMAIGGARRIFLFGADGGVPDGALAITHYGSQTQDFRFDMSPDVREAVAASLRADAIDFDGVIETGLITAEGLFGVKTPPILNVSLSSRLGAFPKITYENAWSMLSGGE